ncbi:MAG TPA: hypothetical protein VKU84_06560, partial [Stellaceae bacterium]|nr:hypothetical protein [Stellaceae bacterium]
VSPVDVHIVCAIRPLTRAYTYSKRTAAFWFLTPMRDLTAPPPDDAGAMQPAAADPLEGYEASPAGLLLSLDSIQGAEGFSYDNGIEPRGLPAFEASRILRGGMTLNAYWQDIYAEQRRDIILVVIGALIGIGATMLIEALRPMVDRLFDLDSVDNT